MSDLYPVAVLCGGLGTRMADVTGPLVPKSLLPVAGRPFLDFKLAGLAAQGARRVVLLTGHGGEAIEAHLAEQDHFGLTVTCVDDGAARLGTGGAVRGAVEHLGDRFWVTYGDTFLRVPMAEAQGFFERHAWEGMMTILRNEDRWDRSNVSLEGNIVAVYDKRGPPGTHAYIDYGLSVMTAAAMTNKPRAEAFELSEAFLEMIPRRALGAFLVRDRFYEIGSPRGYAETDAFFRSQGVWDLLMTSLRR